MTLRCENTRTMSLLRIHPAREGSVQWEPGDLCKVARDNRTIGMVIYYHDAENVLVLWTRAPKNPFEGEEYVQLIKAEFFGNDVLEISALTGDK